MKKPLIEYYESSETAPYRRWQKFLKYLNKKDETGDEPLDIFKRADRSVAYIGAGNTDAAIKEISNLKLAYSHMVNEVGLSAMANAVMIKSINGVLCDDITTGGLQNTIDKLDGTSKREIDEKNQLIKKKSWRNLKSITLKRFPIWGRLTTWLGFRN